jgi:hypothetical protein
MAYEFDGAKTRRGPEHREMRRTKTALPSFVQAKLIVGAVDDPLEREADATAARVMRIIGHADKSPIRRLPHTPASRVQRSHSVGAEGGEVDGRFESKVRSARGGGAPLPSGLGPRLEQAFEADFSSVRVHSGGGAADLNRSIQAQAFTLGSDIFLGESAPSIGSSAGTSLLAHELTHVVQQTGAAKRRPSAGNSPAAD